MNTPIRYTPTAIALHWLIFGLILAAFPLGLYMAGLPLSPTKLKLISYHKWLGVTVFLFVLARLAWRMTHTPPALPPAMPAWERHAAHLLHGLLYLLIFLIPLSGWLMSSAKGIPTVYLGVLPLPDLVAKDKMLGDWLQEIHKTLNFALLALVAVHAGAALKHHFIQHDGVLARMLPFLDKETTR